MRTHPDFFLKSEMSSVPVIFNPHVVVVLYQRHVTLQNKLKKKKKIWTKYTGNASLLPSLAFCDWTCDVGLCVGVLYLKKLQEPRNENCRCCAGSHLLHLGRCSPKYACANMEKNLRLTVHVHRLNTWISITDPKRKEMMCTKYFHSQHTLSLYTLLLYRLHTTFMEQIPFSHPRSASFQSTYPVLILGMGWFCSSSSQILSFVTCQHCRCVCSARSSPVASAETASHTAHGVSRQQKSSHSAKSCQPSKHSIYYKVNQTDIYIHLKKKSD